MASRRELAEYRDHCRAEANRLDAAGPGEGATAEEKAAHADLVEQWRALGREAAARLSQTASLVHIDRTPQADDVPLPLVEG